MATDCGCTLVTRAPGRGPKEGAAFYMCRMHELAGEMLAELKRLRTGWRDTSMVARELDEIIDKAEGKKGA